MSDLITKMIEDRLAGCRKRADRNRKRLGKLGRYEGKRLSQTTKNGEMYFSSYSVDDRTRKYIRKENYQEVQNIQERIFREKYANVLDSNISKYEKCLKVLGGIEFDDPRQVANKLTKAYSSVDDNVIYDEGNLVQIWKENLLALKERYPPVFPENLIHEGSDGFMYRSKSEVIEAEVLRSLGIPYVPEAPIIVGGVVLHPDFTVLDLSSWENKYIEHQGLLTKMNYRTNFADRLGLMIDCDIVPGRNLLLTFDDNKGNISSADIERAIKAFLSIG